MWLQTNGLKVYYPLWYRLGWRLLLSLFGLFSSQQAVAVEQTSTAKMPAKVFRFAAYSTKSSAPFFHQDDRGNYIGVVPSLMAKAAALAGIKVEYVPIDRRGAEFAVYNGDADGMILSRAWAKRPDKVLFSKPIYDLNKYFFSLTPLAKGATPVDWLAGKSVCLRQHYIYPRLQPLIDAGALLPVYLTDFPLMLELLQSGRCETVYMNEHKAQWLIQQKKVQIRVFRSARYWDSVKSSIAVGRQWQAFLLLFNQQVAKIQQTNALKAYIQ